LQKIEINYSLGQFFSISGIGLNSQTNTPPRFGENISICAYVENYILNEMVGERERDKVEDDFFIIGHFRDFSSKK